jgi:hypothetical protein
MVASATRLWVACTTGEQVVALDPASLAVASRVSLDREPDALAVAHGDVVVAQQDGPALAVVRPGSADRPPRVVRREVLGHAGKLYDRANVDVLVHGGTAYVSSNLGGGVYVRHVG